MRERDPEMELEMRPASELSDSRGWDRTGACDQEVAGVGQNWGHVIRRWHDLIYKILLVLQGE